MEQDLYCKIYIDSSASKIELLDKISKLVQGKISLRSIESETMNIDVMENDEYDKDKASQRDGFVYYPYYLEIDAVEGVEASDYIEAIKNLLMQLRSFNAHATASCDFEDQLK